MIELNFHFHYYQCQKTKKRKLDKVSSCNHGECIRGKYNRIDWRNNMKNKHQVRLYWTGCQRTPIHGCDPTTARHGDFCLLGFPPGPVRPSLDNLEISNSFKITILMPSLARTPDRHGTPESRTPDLKPSSDTSLQVAGLQEHATTPSDEKS